MRAEGIEPSAFPLSEGCSTTELSARCITNYSTFSHHASKQHHPPELGALVLSPAKAKAARLCPGMVAKLRPGC